MNREIKFRGKRIDNINFVNETKDGKYTVQKPKIEFSFQRIVVQEQDEFIDIDEYQENSYLFGISS